MDLATRALSDYIAERGIKIVTISEKTNIPYGKLWTSLKKKHSRDLRADEFLAVCSFVGKNPLDFLCTAPQSGDKKGA